MYEKPQYLTPDGYKRLAKNPHAKEKTGPSLYQELTQKKMELAKKRTPEGQKRVLSDKAAKMIAGALKGLLKNK